MGAVYDKVLDQPRKFRFDHLLFLGKGKIQHRAPPAIASIKNSPGDSNLVDVLTRQFFTHITLIWLCQPNSPSKTKLFPDIPVGFRFIKSENRKTP
jgi:hypothetical protein